MGDTEGEFSFLPVSEIKREVAVKEEIQDEFLDDDELSGIKTESIENSPETKCGSILVSPGRTFIFVCEMCGDRFPDMDTFGNHLVQTHLNYDARNETTFKEDIDLDATESCSAESVKEGGATTSGVVQSARKKRDSYAVISRQQKELFIKLIQDGHTIKAAAQISNLNAHTGYSVYRNYISQKSTLVFKKRGGSRLHKLTPEVLATVEEISERNTGLSLKEIKEQLALRNMHLSISSIQRGLSLLKITLKRAPIKLNRMNSEFALQQRRQFAMDFETWVPQNRAKLIFVDEADFNLHLPGMRTRSRLDMTTVDNARIVRDRNIALILAMNNQQVVHSSVIADGNCNSNLFCDFLNALCGKLNAMELYNSILVMNDTAFYRAQDVREAVESFSHTIKFLPPHSPMLNPTEHVFYKIKASARRILEEETAEYDVVDVISCSANNIDATDCSSFVADVMLELQTVHGK